ncbi:FemAB family XrtA/PEP-CTERM system-associated protein [Sphingomonas lycopersici]|uniref:FemAB family PEP-CTERM system-associated protein n=1 Tax=Sphingomonas lycopersici TaxID=2951807 RepID=A0AA42CUP8_9SPHN|nr:FemAB family XrtA/PEP-CTERM system-associated protein [Sphingomonas lycopersici]MCW6529332.1 FemAB family PEP-CTERM system-associated protein [Sphingomonas lycopersici]MCW6535656.1 FemAB family PEP-CTERM system-associated protein [Sphingomonas lycopersici]
MTFAVRKATAADDAAITAFVRAQPAATPFHLPAWSRAIERGCRQRAHYLIAERDGAIAGVLPLTEMRSPLFGNALVSAGFAVDGGVLGEGGEALVAAACALGLPSIELRGGAAPVGWAVDDTTYLGFVRPLAADDEAELAAIPRKQRAEMRKALANELEVVTGGAERAGEHYVVYAESVRNLGTPVFPRALFRAVLETMDADVLTVRHQGRAVASVLSLYFNDIVYPYWGGGTAAARGLRANDRMYFALMSHARARGCTAFDFGRSKAGTGAAAFKKNWGFEGVPLAYAKWSEGAAREINPLNPKYALMVRTWQRLPLPLANLLGPWISRGLG